MPTCPECGRPMKKNKYGVYVCENCGGAYVPKSKHSGTDSMFGITV